MPKEKFLALIQQYQALINSLCRAWFPDPTDQLDARQDVIMQLWKAFPNFRAAASAKTWIYKVSLNTLLNKVRNEKKHRGAVNLQQANSLSHPPHHLVDDDLQLLRQIINSLSANDKALVILQIEGYSQQEIADILNISISNVSTRLYRIRKTLKKQYQSIRYESK